MHRLAAPWMVERKFPRVKLERRSFYIERLRVA
jgi:hypothetical protein